MGIEFMPQPADGTLTLCQQWMNEIEVDRPWWPYWLQAARAQLLHGVRDIGTGALPRDAVVHSWAQHVLDDIGEMPGLLEYRDQAPYERARFAVRQFESHSKGLESYPNSRTWNRWRAELDELSPVDAWPAFAVPYSADLWDSVLAQMWRAQELRADRGARVPTEAEPSSARMHHSHDPHDVADPAPEVFELLQQADDSGLDRLLVAASHSLYTGVPLDPLHVPVADAEGNGKHTRPLVQPYSQHSRPEPPLHVGLAVIELATVMACGGISVLGPEDLERERIRARSATGPRVYFVEAAHGLDQALRAVVRRSERKLDPTLSDAAYDQNVSRYTPHLTWILAQVLTAQAVIAYGRREPSQRWLEAARGLVVGRALLLDDSDVAEAWRGGSDALQSWYDEAVEAKGLDL